MRKSVSIGTRLRRFLASTIILSLLIVTLAIWWHSSRYSERHQIFLGAGTLEVFSASSLCRLSLIADPRPIRGPRTFYRQRNARGRFDLSPAKISTRWHPPLFEITFGYWHLTLILMGALIPCIWLETLGWVRFRRRDGI
ncbi:MAG: hypothetical protein AAF236_05200 [Verrucomicrobiota bacterium]